MKGPEIPPFRCPVCEHEEPHPKHQSTDRWEPVVRRCENDGVCGVSSFFENGEWIPMRERER